MLDKPKMLYYNDKADFKVDLSATLIFKGSLLHCDCCDKGKCGILFAIL